MYIFEVKLTLEMLTVHGQQHSFSTHERVFLGSVKVFKMQKMSATFYIYIYIKYIYLYIISPRSVMGFYCYTVVV